MSSDTVASSPVPVRPAASRWREATSPLAAGKVTVHSEPPFSSSKREISKLSGVEGSDSKASFIWYRAEVHRECQLETGFQPSERLAFSGATRRKPKYL